MPVICTAGGATDDFCAEPFALPVRSEVQSMAIDDIPDARILRPDEDHLVEQMIRAIEDEELRRVSRDAGPAAVSRNFTWAQVTDRLLTVLFPS